MLGGAVADLFDALPAPYGESLADLPLVVERLREHAAQARSVLVRLDQALPAALGGVEVSETRQLALRQLTDSVSAIEAIRLDLLRLQAGASDLASAETALHTARHVDAELDALRQRTARRLGRTSTDLDRRQVTPV